ncbi:chemotaxis protein CheA [Skermanella stibiiresistens SB22]|uniref:Chemotaxis protein CheA n=1 Tax=Skermanella stibiiresistens SB22 TaxID=1385369 RepID=W9H548_9PROT|nr:chemotaxis protein CheA [Skermanella stibiiresistens SB22]
MDDLERFKVTYFDECGELLAVAEAGLLRLSPENIDLDEINAVFRAVHSIKGGGGTFGFSALVTFTHEFEAVMDRLRSQQIGLTTELVDVLIRANDVMARLLTCARDGIAVPPGLADASAAELAGFLQKKPSTAARRVLEEPAKPTVTSAPAEAKRSFVVHFMPKSDLLLSGNEPAFLLRALKRLGHAEIVCDTGRVPPLYDLDGESLYLFWQIALTGAMDEAAIRDVFEFVVDDCQIDIVETTGVADGGEDEAFGLFAENMPYVPPGQLTIYGAGAGGVPGGVPDGADGAQTPAIALPGATEGSGAGGGGSGGGGSGGGGSGGLGGHSIRVDLDKVDRLVNLVGEMVITQAMITEQLRDLPPGTLQQLVAGLEELGRHTRELQESVMAIRAQQVRSVFARMPRLVREVAAQTGKEVQLATSGETTEVDKTVVENLVDPLTHMIRNSIDHGLETPDEREAIGKPRGGTVHLSARHRSSRIVIEVADDGRGINRPRVLQKAIEQGLVAAGASLSDEEIDNLIFLPGFSTADAVSAISGRGVGMDVVRRNIASLGGRIVVQSTPGVGTRFVLSLPLTLAVLDGMVISVGSQRFVLPLTNIIESLRPRKTDLQSVANQCDVIMARGDYVRLVYVDRLFRIDDAIGDPTRGLVVLVETEEGGRLGLVVDEVLGQQQVVIKSLESNFQRLDGVSAATILGDGRVALILDIAGLQGMSRQTSNRVAATAALPAA